jgi:flagellar assembly factor FliW
MEIHTKFFGTIELNTREVLDFPEGIPGFEHMRRFMWYQPENSVFSCLQAVDRTELAFITISPFLVCPDYAFELEGQVAGKLELNRLEDALLLALVTIPEGNPHRSTANLKAPLVINCRKRRGYQVIVDDKYALRTPLVNQATDRKDKIQK